MDCEWRNVCHDSDGFVAEAMMIHTNYALKEEGRCPGRRRRRTPVPRTEADGLGLATVRLVRRRKERPAKFCRSLTTHSHYLFS